MAIFHGKMLVHQRVSLVQDRTGLDGQASDSVFDDPLASTGHEDTNSRHEAPHGC